MSAFPSTRNISPSSILEVETPQFPDILYLRYFGQDKETEARPRGGGGGQMSMKPCTANLDPTSISGQPRRASCLTSLSDLEGRSSSRVKVARKRRSEFRSSPEGGHLPLAPRSCPRQEEVKSQGSTGGKRSYQIQGVSGCPCWRGQGKQGNPNSERRGLACPWYLYANRGC